MAGCAQNAVSPNAPAADVRTDFHVAQMGLPVNSKISHVVIIFQKNRSVDNLFHGLPGADTVNSGLNSAGGQVRLQPVSLTAPFDPDHLHTGFETEFDSGKMDGFNLEITECYAKHNACGLKSTRVYGYVPQKEVQPYFTMAEEYAFGDRMFQSNSGPSFPAHQYILSGTSTISKDSPLRASAKAIAPSQEVVGGCDSPTGSLALTINAAGAENKQVFPCFERPSLTDLVEAKGLTWHYYVSHLGPTLWNAPDAIKHIREGSQYSTDVTAPPQGVLTDIAHGNLANVVWVMPTAADSDHAHGTDGTGPAWVSSVVNAIGKSKYWDSTVIFLTWDDWGGWYDHVPPQQYDAYELGFRVPLVVISAYTPKGYISKKQHEFGSILKFVETTFGLGSLGTTDVRSDNMADFFKFSSKPRSFTPIPAPLGANYFLKQRVSNNDNADDDF
jgi:phospholipase C